MVRKYKDNEATGAYFKGIHPSAEMRCLQHAEYHLQTDVVHLFCF